MITPYNENNTTIAIQQQQQTLNANVNNNNILPDGATRDEQTVVALGDVPTTDQRGYFGQQLGFEESRDGCRFKGVAVGVGGGGDPVTGEGHEVDPSVELVVKLGMARSDGVGENGLDGSHELVVGVGGRLCCEMGVDAGRVAEGGAQLVGGRQVDDGAGCVGESGEVVAELVGDALVEGWWGGWVVHVVKWSGWRLEMDGPSRFIDVT